MKRLILFAAILFGLTGITRAQTTETKTKIERHGFKKKTKVEGDGQNVLMSTSAHPAYIHHHIRHYTTTSRHTSMGTRHAAHVKPTNVRVTHHNATHMTYKKMKRKHKNGEYKIKYKA